MSHEESVIGHYMHDSHMKQKKKKKSFFDHVSIC